MIKKLTFLLIVSLFCAQDAKALGLDTVASELHTLIQGARPASVSKICGKGGVCRGWGGLACYNHHLFSLCWLLCKHKPSFLQSLCVRSNATEYLGFEADQAVFVKKDKKIAVLAHLQEAIYNPNKSALDKVLLCENICPIAVITLEAEKKGGDFLEQISASLIRAACKIGCR